ncbi:MAG TPA: 50S ribosomal protein L13 [Candidatus Omnitrophota bacterium]|jgi:large subunit ribosomal protein L13|nr:MAG: 50S ribosomal protein L13 [Candidatus Omnitrophica bacterium ADurb.Bin314]HOE68341.1 50S ribosomal protein L13 [Candidatus Omnitrophota bacterium]HQB94407.1 50S ribosomal protein L13 [Candidatus Omnitrophota bacterium]
MKTFIPKEKDINRKVYLIDASGKTLGRLATKAASLLIGKGKACFAKDQITGDQVIVINAAKIRVTGKKKEQKVYTRWSGYSGGFHSVTLEELMEKKPADVITKAVTRMLPKTRNGDVMAKRLRVFAGPDYNHKAQKPIQIEVS